MATENAFALTITNNDVAPTDKLQVDLVWGTGTTSVDDKKHARELLDWAWNHDQIEAGVDQLMIEMNAAAKSPGQTRKEFRSAIVGDGEVVPGEVPTNPGRSNTAPKSAPKTIKFNDLPP